jgi:pimeloyl-ACP methyl ester carboxylesterase
MSQLISADRTSIAYEQTGHGPAVVLIHVGPFTQALNAGLASLLADRFTVYTYDRRGRGESGGTIADGPDREFDDLRAVIDQAGGHAHVYGSSGAGIIALQAASRGLPISRLAVWEPPYAVETPNPPADWGPQIASLIAAGHRGDGVAYWMTTILGMPEPAVAGMREAPFWAGMEAEAHGLVADHALVGDLSFPPAGQLRAIEVPTLVLDGGPGSPLAPAAVQVARGVPGARHQSLDGQPHNVDDAVMAAALTEFFG